MYIFKHFMHLILLGPPGSGKGSQTKLVQSFLRSLYPGKDCATFGMGDLLRDEVASGSSLGQELAVMMKSGNLVDYQVTNRLAKEKILGLAKNPWIFEGYPRQLEQLLTEYNGLESFVKEDPFATVDKVIYLNLSEEDVYRRLLGRRQGKDGQIFHLEFDPPPVGSYYDLHPEELVIRPDDKQASIEKRLKTFALKTMPVIQHYRETGKLLEVDASLSKEEVLKQITTALS